ncbi:MAG: dihydrolipoyl dehydrogenase [Planctomycetota bacterium]|jgi:dihydrolipoamide dehydrogenase
MVVGEFTLETHLVVVGGGPGGYTAAFRAAELDVPTVIVDSREALGGVCLHEGCIPSKTLLHVTETIGLAQHADRFGVHYKPPKIELESVRDWMGRTIGTLAGGLGKIQQKHGIEHLCGRAHFEDGKILAVPGTQTPRVKFRRAIIATGTVPREHAALPFDGEHVLRPGEAVRLPKVPSSLLVLGGNYMSVEIASAYAALGARVTLVTPTKLLPAADVDLQRPLHRRLRETLAEVVIGADVQEASMRDDRVEVVWRGETTPASSSFETVVVSIGQRANLDDLHLDRLEVRTCDEGFIEIDDHCATSVPRILAIGDVTGPPLLADKAIYQGRIAAEQVAGWDSAFDARAIPFVVFTDPPIAWCGLTEDDARQQEIPVRVRRIPWGASGRAAGMGRTEGLTKIISDPDTGLVLGVGVAGPQAAEMIAEGCLALEMGAELTDLAGTIHPHPTMSEMLADAARLARGSDS